MRKQKAILVIGLMVLALFSNVSIVYAVQDGLSSYDPYYDTLEYHDVLTCPHHPHLDKVGYDLTKNVGENVARVCGISYLEYSKLLRTGISVYQLGLRYDIDEHEMLDIVSYPDYIDINNRIRNGTCTEEAGEGFKTIIRDFYWRMTIHTIFFPKN